MGNCLSALGHPERTRQRRSLGNVFDRKAPDSLRAPVENMVEKQPDRLGEHLRVGPADFTSPVSEELPVATLGRWLRLPSADDDLIRTLTRNEVWAKELLPTKRHLAAGRHLAGRRRRTGAAAPGEPSGLPGGAGRPCRARSLGRTAHGDLS